VAIKLDWRDVVERIEKRRTRLESALEASEESKSTTAAETAASESSESTTNGSSSHSTPSGEEDATTNVPSSPTNANTLPESTEMILGADVVYEMEHGRLFPIVCKEYLAKTTTARAHCVLPLREKFEKELAYFEEQMDRSLKLLHKEDYLRDEWEERYPDAFEGPDRGFRYYVYGHF
jgi:hypothetical protein